MEKYSVGALIAEINGLLSGEFEDIWVEGEVSGFKAVGSGHWYFSLKDPTTDAVVSCAMFAFANKSVRTRPKDGDVVLLRGGIDVYAPRGSFSIKVKRLEHTGAGELAAKLEALKRKLAAEGLFDPAKKVELPPYPRAIGVATSPTGAALQDIIRVVRGRWPGMPIYVAGCRVQGDGAAREVAAAVKLLDESGKCDVVLVGRGGGSAEDLFAFNEEVVVRAVAACVTPIVSCVGHEVDHSLCDLAADIRAATPSHAAELVVPEQEELSVWVDGQLKRMCFAVLRRIKVGRDKLARVRLQHPRQRIERGRMRADELDERIRKAMARWMLRRRERLESRVGKLDALSPLKVLDRGYAITMKDGVAIVDSTQLKVGDAVELRFARGRADAVIKRTRGLF